MKNLKADFFKGKEDLVDFSWFPNLFFHKFSKKEQQKSFGYIIVIQAGWLWFEVEIIYK